MHLPLGWQNMGGRELTAYLATHSQEEIIANNRRVRSLTVNGNFGGTRHAETPLFLPSLSFGDIAHSGAVAGIPDKDDPPKQKPSFAGAATVNENVLSLPVMDFSPADQVHNRQAPKMTTQHTWGGEEPLPLPKLW